MQFLIDFSGNELTLQYIDHSNFQAEGAYLLLEKKVERVSQQFYLDISTLPLSSIKHLMDLELNLISRIALQRTVVKVYKLIVDTLIQSFQTHYFAMYKEFPVMYVEDLPSDPLVYTAFGKMLFSNDNSATSTKKVKIFIEHLRAKKLVNDINEYNELVFYIQDMKNSELQKENSEKDEEIEYVNSNAGYSLEVSK